MPTTPEEDLAQLEKDIRTLKIEYEQFFGGGRQRPPADTQWRVESLIRRYSDRSAQMSYSQRFRYTNIAQTFAKYCEIWRKKIKEREEGTTHRHFGAAAKAIEAQRATSTGHAEPKRPAKGEKGGTPSFEDFGEFVRQKTRELKGKKRTAQVEYTVSVEDGRVKLKARVSS